VDPDTWQKRLDLRSGHDKGRIYRVYPVDKKPRVLPRLDRLDTTELVAALDSASGWQRDAAQQLLIERRDKAAVPLLESQAASCPRPAGRLHALATLAGFAPLREAVLVKALADGHPASAATPCGCRKQIPSLSPDALSRLLQRAGDSDPQVRLQMAYTLGEIKGPPRRSGRAAIGRMLAADGHDRFLLAALMSSVDKANVEDVLSSVVTASGKGAPNQNLIGSLLDVAAALGNDQALATLVQYVTGRTTENSRTGSTPLSAGCSIPWRAATNRWSESESIESSGGR